MYIPKCHDAVPVSENIVIGKCSGGYIRRPRNTLEKQIQ